MPKISVLLTAYNSEKYIASALNSLLFQTFKEFEIILVDDGSSDNTLNIIKSFKDPRIKLYCKSNTGLIDSLNFGTKKCNSELIARFDSDDLCFKNRLETQYFNFNNNDSVLASNALIINDRDEVIGKTNFSTNDNKIIKSLHNLNNCIIHPTTLINKEHLIKSGGYNINFKYAEDFELWLRISKYGKLKLIKEPLIYLRKHSFNISHLNLNGQLVSSIKALVKSKLENTLISENQLSQFVDNFLRVNKNYKYYFDSTNYFIENNSKSYYRMPEKIIYKLLYTRNKRQLIKSINNLVDDIGKCS